MPTLPAAGDASWRDDWAQAVHDAATAVADGRLSVAELAETVRDTIGTALVAGANVTITADDAANTITIAAAGTDAEVVRDTIGTALTAGTGITKTVNDAGDTITIAASAASDTAQGIVELATTAEVQTGTDTARAVTPAGLKAGRRQQVTARTTAHTAAAADVEKLITMTHASTAAVTLPSDANDANIAIGDWIEYLQLGAGQTTFTAGSGATLVTPTGATAACRGLNCRVVAQKISANTYALAGDLA